MTVPRHTQQLDQMEQDDVNFTDSDLVFHVRDALISVQSGDSDLYNDLVGVMHHKKGSDPHQVALLVASLKALAGAVTYINNVHHSSLLNSIFGMSMWDCQPDVRDALRELIVALAASGGEHVDSCFDMLVNNFVPPYNFPLGKLKQPHGQARKEQVLSQVHRALAEIADLMPITTSILTSKIVQKMPKILARTTEKDHCCIMIYVENMLKLESGVIREHVGRKMLMAVVDILIELDAAINWNGILEDDSCKGIFAIELEDEEDEPAAGDWEDGHDDQLPRTLCQKWLLNNSVADLLDSLMVQTFEHLESCASNKHLTEVFETLLCSFEQTVLKTLKSKFTQFVMFYACALDPENCGEKFAEMLANKFINSCYDELSRRSAVGYLASFLARAKFLHSDFVATMLKRLVDWCCKYCEVEELNTDPKVHKVFYSACQAVMYVLCFRMRSMMDDTSLKSQLLLMPIERILKNELQPLKVCLPSIVEEFLKQANSASLFTISEELPFEYLVESDLSRDFGGTERLDMFFPFDPCLLKDSDRNFIRPNFVYWKNVKTTYSGVDEDSSDEEITEGFAVDGNEEFMLEALARSSCEQDVDLALDKMSITPKNDTYLRIGGDDMRMPSRIRPSMSPESL